MKYIIIIYLLCTAFFFISCNDDFQNIEEEIIVEELAEETNYEELRKKNFNRSYLSLINTNIIGSTSSSTSSITNTFTDS